MVKRIYPAVFKPCLYLKNNRLKSFFMMFCFPMSKSVVFCFSKTYTLYEIMTVIKLTIFDVANVIQGYAYYWPCHKSGWSWGTGGNRDQSVSILKHTNKTNRQRHSFIEKRYGYQNLKAIVFKSNEQLQQPELYVLTDWAQNQSETRIS